MQGEHGSLAKEQEVSAVAAGSLQEWEKFTTTAGQCTSTVEANIGTRLRVTEGAGKDTPQRGYGVGSVGISFPVPTGIHM